MSLFDIFRGNDINKAVEDYKNTPGAVLIDVRSKNEYSAGHIPGSINIPDKEIQAVTDVIQDFNTPVFVYCLGGSRSWNAAKVMKNLGYKNVKNIGGINNYTGVKEM